MITIQITDGVHKASRAFGATLQGTPEESAKAFLRALSHGGLGKLDLMPLDCDGIDMGEDFRPFTGCELRRVASPVVTYVDAAGAAHSSMVRSYWCYEVAK